MGYMHIEDSLKLEIPMLLALETVKCMKIGKKNRTVGKDLTVGKRYED